MSVNESELLAQVPTSLYINGAWVEGHADKPISVEDPATGKTLHWTLNGLVAIADTESPMRWLSVLIFIVIMASDGIRFAR